MINSEELKKIVYHCSDTLKHKAAIMTNGSNLFENYQKSELSFVNIAANINKYIGEAYDDTVIGEVCKNSQYLQTVPGDRLADVFVKTLSIYLAYHDDSKLNGIEYEGYKNVVWKLKGLEYGTKEHKAAIKELDGPFIYHCKDNAHHPEHYSEDHETPMVSKMDLESFTEMILDWTAAAVCRGFKFKLSSVNIQKKKQLKLDNTTIEIIIENIKLMLPPELIDDDLK